MEKLTSKYECIVIGVSAGGLHALKAILSFLPADFQVPCIVVQHMHPDSGRFLIKYLNDNCLLTVQEAEEKDRIKTGYVYIAPPNYHLLVERDQTFSLSIDDKVKYSRPSIDVLFKSASDAYHSKLIGIILTGANDDGSLGLKKIKENGGLAIVQDPKSAEADTMPISAIAACPVDHVLDLNEIAKLLVSITSSS